MFNKGHFMKILTLSRFVFISLVTFISMFGQSTYAYFLNGGTMNNVNQTLSTYTLDCSHWYAGANIGMSHLHDKNNPGSNDSVDENGPGGSVVGGYQFNS